MAEQERPPLWRVMAEAYGEATDSTLRDLDCIATGHAAEIRAVAQYLQDHGLVSTTSGKATPGADRRLLEALEAEARRAEAGE